MESNKFFPKIIGETRIGTYYVAPIFSLRTDNEMTTIWLDLETKKDYFKKKPLSAYNSPVIRKSLGAKDDFILYTNHKLKTLFDMFKTITDNPIPIPNMIEIILNPEKLGEEQHQLIEYITQFTQNFTQQDKKDLLKLNQLISNLKKTNISRLLNESKYTLILGNLTPDNQYINKVATQTQIELKQQYITQNDIKEVFNKIILDDSIFKQVFTSLGLQNICATPPQPPQTGGAIFVDMGGTGKTLMKDALMDFWKKLGGECLEKNGIAEFSKTENYAGLIGSWYYGYEGKAQGYDKKGLIKAANENKVPSLLIIDEADRFIAKESEDKAAELIITELKRHLNKSTQGKVLTLFIANVDEKDINPQLKQGGTRLTLVYFGPPKNQQDWVELISMYIEESKLQFEDRNSHYDTLLAKLILFHNSNMPSEKYMIVPRKFGPNFCKRYINNYFSDKKTVTNKSNKWQIIHSMLHTNQDKDVKVKYNDFIKNFIDDYLLKEIKSANMQIEYYKKQYYEFIELDWQKQKTTNNQKNPSSDIEKAEVNLILQDKDTKRIIKSQYGFELLGINPNETKTKIIETWRKTLKDFVAQGGDKGYRFKDRIIQSLMAQKLLEHINGKINNVNKENIKQAVQDKYNWDEYKHFVNN
ncbi:MAG: ATP-binding protein [Nanoarchaeota archaeon]